MACNESKGENKKDISGDMDNEGFAYAFFEGQGLDIDNAFKELITNSNLHAVVITTPYSLLLYRRVMRSSV